MNVKKPHKFKDLWDFCFSGPSCSPSLELDSLIPLYSCQITLPFDEVPVPVPVKLPPDPLIDYWMLCKALARAKCPTDESYFVGIKCVVGKAAIITVPAEPNRGHGLESAQFQEQYVLVSDEGASLDQLRGDFMIQDRVTELAQISLLAENSTTRAFVDLPLKWPLESKDQDTLLALLPNLPPLRYPMSEDERADFLAAYWRLKERPAWMPVLMTAEDMQDQKSNYSAAFEKYKKALQDEFLVGRLTAVNALSIPVKVLNASSFIPRTQVIAFLDRWGILYCEKGQECCGEVDAAVPALQQEQADAKPNVGKRKLREGQWREVVEFQNKLKREGRGDFSKATAKKYGITARYVRDLADTAAKAKAEKPEGQIDHLVVKRRP